MDMDNVTETGKEMGQRISEKGQQLADRVTDKVQDFSQRIGENEPQLHSEGPIARILESQTARVPSDVFLWAAFGSIGASLLLKARGRDATALFVGQWAPTFLILGLYNKLVKVAGSDRLDQGRPLFERGEQGSLH